jgi:hypothetical protein
MKTYAKGYIAASTPNEIANWANELIGTEIGGRYIADKLLSITMTVHIEVSRRYYDAIAIFEVHQQDFFDTK